MEYNYARDKMDLIRKETPEFKISVLAESANYDKSAKTSFQPGMLREAEAEYGLDYSSGDTTAFKRMKESDFFHNIYKTVGPGGKCVSLFKVLQTNKCERNCLYCVNRKSRNTVRTSFKSEELAKVFMNFYRKKYVSGIFLSSGIYDSPVKTMDEMIKTILILRNTYKFGGYVHLKILPGVQDAQIEEAMKISDRVSINLESPDENLLRRIAPEKRFKEEIFRAINSIKSFNENGLKVKNGFTTQFISGVLEETDFDLLKRTVMLYDEFKLRRAYFSGFSPVVYTPFENKNACPLMREHRLYQADFLMRLYGFDFSELSFEGGNLSLEKDPKEVWAEQHSELFPVELNKASYEELIRIPGIGIKSARRIVETRRESSIDEDALRNMRVVLKRAHKYILVSGKKVKYGRSKHEEEPLTLFDFRNPYFAEV